MKNITSTFNIKKIRNDFPSNIVSWQILCKQKGARLRQKTILLKIVK